MASGNEFNEEQKNGFKLYGEQMEEEVAGPSADMEEDIANQLHFVKQKAGIIDLYLSKIVDLIIAMMGGGKEEKGDSDNDSDHSPQGRVKS